jgi:hypothetical protein
MTLRPAQAALWSQLRSLVLSAEIAAFLAVSNSNYLPDSALGCPNWIGQVIGL